MTASLLVLLLVAVRAVVGGTNVTSLPDDTEPLGSCVPSILEGVLLSANNLPDWVINLKQVAMETAQGMAGGAPEDNQLLGTLKKHPQLAAIAASLPRLSGYAAVVYRSSEGKLLVHRLTNSSLVDTAWRSLLDVVRNQSYHTSGTSEMWTPLFLDCLTRNWLFGYSTSLNGYSI
jgi:hypothetical protein